MKREEEILQVANENYSGCSERRLGFVAGANWADKTMLDRACEWLRFRVRVDVPIETNENGEPLADSWIKGTNGTCKGGRRVYNRL